MQWQNIDIEGMGVCECVPCLATITLAMQSGTLVPAARKVMPMMTSGIPRVKPMTVT